MSRFTFPSSKPLGSFFPKLRILFILLLLIAGVAFGFYVVAFKPNVALDEAVAELEEPPKVPDVQFLKRPPFSVMRDFGTRPIPVSGGRENPFQP